MRHTVNGKDIWESGVSSIGVITKTGENIEKVRGKLDVTLREILFMAFIGRRGGKPSVRTSGADGVRDILKCQSGKG